MKNKLISLLLGILLVCSLTPFAFADTEEEVTYPFKVTYEFYYRYGSGWKRAQSWYNTITEKNKDTIFSNAKKMPVCAGQIEKDKANTVNVGMITYTYNNHWKSVNNPGSTQIDVKDTDPITMDASKYTKETVVRFEAQYTEKQKYRIYFDGIDNIGRGDCSAGHDKVITEYSHTFKEPADVDKTKYKFVYWEDSEHDIICEAGQTFTKTSEELDKDTQFTFYATYKPIPTIEYYDQNNNYIGSATSEEVDIYDAGAEYVPEVNGTFEGWYNEDGVKINEGTIKSYDLTTKQVETTTKVYAHFSYTVTWIDEDGTVLETDEKLEYGSTPSYDGDIPTKDSDLTYNYTFASWTPDIVDVTEDTTYAATYDKTLIPIEPEPIIDPDPDPDPTPTPDDPTPTPDPKPTPDDPDPSNDKPQKQKATPTKPATKTASIQAPIINYGYWPTDKPYEEDEEVPTTIQSNSTPTTAKKQGAWALINLIATILTVLISLILLIMAIINKRKEDDDLEIKNKMPGRIISIIIAILSIIIFIFTENMSLPMIWVDKWTLLMVLIFIVQFLIMILCKHKEEEIEEDEEEE